MKELLIVIQHIRRGGPENVAINYAEFLDKTKYHISFLLINPYEDEDEKLERELVSKGYSIYKLPQNANSYLRKYSFINRFFKENKYDIVHSHVIFFSGLVLRAAAKNGVTVRASHSHIIRWNRKENILYKLYTALMRTLLKKYSTLKFACSTQSGEFLYGKREYQNNGIFIPNGIDTNLFLFNQNYRDEIRNEFHIADGDVLVGHVGTVYKIKNQAYLVRVFAEMLRLNPSCKLLLVGQIVDADYVRALINECGVNDKVGFTDSRSDVNKFYSAFDVMVFPSLFEALPVSLIEAQASLLPCLISDRITNEVKFNGNISFLSLEQDPRIWAEHALALLDSRNQSDNDKLIAEYDINNVVKSLDEYYSSIN